MPNFGTKQCKECKAAGFDKMVGYPIPYTNGKFRVACTRDACRRITAFYNTGKEAIYAWNHDEVAA